MSPTIVCHGERAAKINEDSLSVQEYVDALLMINVGIKASLERIKRLGIFVSENSHRRINARAQILEECKILTDLECGREKIMRLLLRLPFGVQAFRHMNDNHPEFSVQNFSVFAGDCTE